MTIVRIDDAEAVLREQEAYFTYEITLVGHQWKHVVSLERDQHSQPLYSVERYDPIDFYDEANKYQRVSGVPENEKHAETLYRFISSRYKGEGFERLISDLKEKELAYQLFVEEDSEKQAELKKIKNDYV